MLRSLSPVFAIAFVVLAASSHAQSVDDVVRLAKAGVNEEVIVAFVQASKSKFSLSTDDILKLKDANVSERVTLTMLRHDPAAGEVTVLRRGGAEYSQPKAVASVRTADYRPATVQTVAASDETEEPVVTNQVVREVPSASYVSYAPTTVVYADAYPVSYAGCGYYSYYPRYYGGYYGSYYYPRYYGGYGYYGSRYYGGSYGHGYYGHGYVSGGYRSNHFSVGFGYRR